MVIQFFSRWILALSLSAAFVVQAQGVVSQPANVEFGTVFHLHGDLVATAPNGTLRALKKGDKVFVGDTLRTAMASEAVIKTKDAGIVALRPVTEMHVQQFAAQAAKTDRQIIQLLSGSLRLISGWIGLVNRDEHRVITPAATIGIRGTDYEPWVLHQSSKDGKYLSGTYNKVNRGQTLLEASGGAISIDAGKVGFARGKADTKRLRAIITLLMPQILDAVPDFYVEGAYDAELYQYSQTSDVMARLALKQANPSLAESLSTASTPAATSLEKTPEHRAGEKTSFANVTGAACQSQGMAWLQALDAALLERNADKVLRLFAEDVQVMAVINAAGQSKTIQFNRDELVRSTIRSIESLQDYRQRREANQVEALAVSTEGVCKKMMVQSLSIEQGVMGGRSFRFQAVERYVLEQRGDEWVAISVNTQQQ